MNFEEAVNKAHELTDSFNPICMKCNAPTGDCDTDKDGFDCPKCGFSIVDSAIAQIEIHYKGLPRQIIDALKDGTRDEFK